MGIASGVHAPIWSAVHSPMGPGGGLSLSASNVIGLVTLWA